MKIRTAVATILGLVGLMATSCVTPKEDNSVRDAAFSTTGDYTPMHGHPESN